MNETVVTSVAEFQARLQELESDEAGFLYRGQTDAALPVSCSAARRLTQDPANPIEDQLISSLLVGYLEFLISKARMRGFLPSGFSEASPDLELLAQLQHQGAATGLIDFTRQPFVALWFACNQSYETDGAVYVLHRSVTEAISNSSDLKKKIQSFYEKDELLSWEPSTLGNRIVAQSSVFVLGVPEIASDRMERFLVQAESKSGILNQLDTVYGVNEEMLFPDFPGFAVANAHNKTFDVKRTVSYWREQIKLASDDSERVKAHFKCGVAYSAIKELENAIEQYDAAIRINPEYAGVYNNRGLAKAGLDRYEAAIADYDAAIRINPEYAGFYSNRGLAKEILDRYEEAIADYDVAIRINPKDAGTYSNRGLAKAILDRDEEAIADYDVAIRINPKDAGTYNNRGLAKAILDRYEEAIADYDVAIRINPKDAGFYNSRGTAKAILGRPEEAIADCDVAIGINPRAARAYNNRGLAKAILDRYEEAIADHDVAIGINPRGDAGFYSNRGTAKAGLGRHKEAIVDYDEAIDINPKDAGFYNNRGLAKARLGRYEEAIADYDEAIRINPGFAEAYFSQGNAKANLDRYEEAIADYDEAIRIRPGFAEVYLRRGLTRKFLQQDTAAIEDFERARTLAQNQGFLEFVQSIKQELDDLNSE